MIKPYTRADLIALATDPRGPQPVDPLRALATYANPNNWESVISKDEREPRVYWAWKGPTITGYELAGWGLRKEQE